MQVDIFGQHFYPISVCLGIFLKFLRGIYIIPRLIKITKSANGQTLFSWEYNLEFKIFEPSLLFRSPWLVKSLRFGGIKYSTTNQKLPFGISLNLTIQNTINFLFFQIFVSVSLWRCTYWLKKKSHYFYQDIKNLNMYFDLELTTLPCNMFVWSDTFLKEEKEISHLLEILPHV